MALGACGISASIPCAGEKRHPCLFSPSGFCFAKIWEIYSRRHPCRPSVADSKGNSGILPPPFGRNPASMPSGLQKL
jgi:hypothetical protein